MHFEILVEDASGRITLNAILPKILGTQAAQHTYRCHAYKGIGTLPKNLRPGTDARKRILLDQLPRILQGYGRSLPIGEAAVVVVVDQDRHNCKELKKDLLNVLHACRPRPEALFRIAVEETEAWLLGDRAAVRAAYPKANSRILDRYAQDSICDTWSILAEAVYPGGAAALKRQGYPLIGQAKCAWAERIAPLIEPDRNASKSFQVFRDGIRRMAGIPRE
jgi:Domain of unknown function (DUF4276)